MQKFEVGGYYKSYTIVGRLHKEQLHYGAIYYKIIGPGEKPFCYKIKYDNGKIDEIDCRFSKAHKVSKLEGMMKVKE